MGLDVVVYQARIMDVVDGFDQLEGPGEPLSKTNSIWMLPYPIPNGPMLAVLQ